MSAFLRAIGFAALLSLPGHWLAPTYQALLFGAMSIVLGTELGPRPGAAADLSPANLLTVFAALCLASGFVPWRRRFAAIGLGIPVLMGVECASGIAGMTLGPALGRMGPQVFELSRWVAVPLVWAALLGRLWLADPEREAHRRAGAAP